MAATQQQIDAIALALARKVYVGLGAVADNAVPAIKDAAEAAYNWVEANESGYNTALTDPFKSNATAAQKAWLLAYAVSEFVKTK